MSIRYPNGKPYHINNDKKTSGNQLKKKKPSYSNRGMTLEEDLNATNAYYLEKNQAVIHKKPIPIQVVNVNYPRRSAAKITEAYFRKASTTDYNGIYKGRYIDFEAKETRNKTSFPLKNFHEHQLDHMQKCHDHGGICFVIIRFSALNRVFLVDFTSIHKWWQQQFKDDKKKSIPLKNIENEGFEINYKFSPRLPYLDVLDKLIAQE
ncbi:MAG: Holliday junction resolvase RecU [Alkalibacterium gilvum]|uniref:Holliday junction resolvase RecU n=1 Tax=Alkalibacterium gilvum TaxID=1130080 RepID=UPI003F93493D